MLVDLYIPRLSTCIEKSLRGLNFVQKFGPPNNNGAILIFYVYIILNIATTLKKIFPTFVLYKNEPRLSINTSKDSKSNKIDMPFYYKKIYYGYVLNLYYVRYF